MSFIQASSNYSHSLSNGFKSTLTSYQPKSSPLNLSVLSKVSEYRDYKFSNGFWYLNQKELIDLVSKMSLVDFQHLLDQLYSTNPELYSLFKKLVMEESSEDDYRNYMSLLEKTDVMKYNYSRLYGS
jgi:hypothetical protein